ncbi:MAG TPA: TonB family protein [Blastocatellia bacterium]|nr:TonB family protein [Blastocatellia bacterium]
MRHKSYTKPYVFALAVMLMASPAGAARAEAGQASTSAPVPERLLRDLRGRDAAARRAAAVQIGGLRARAGVPALVEALSDKEAGTREAAAFALGQIADWGAYEPLARALRDKDPEVRAAAAFALGMVGDPEAAGVLSKALEDPEASVRGSAITAMGLLQDDEGVDEIVEMLADPSYDVRYSAVWALGRIGEPDSADHLRSAMAMMEVSRVSEAMKESFRLAALNSLENLRTGQSGSSGATSRPRRASESRDEGKASRASRPVMIRQPIKPAPTERALRARASGLVGLRVLVEASGRPVRAYVTRRLGYGLDQRAVETVMQYRFDPALEKGLPQTTWINLDVKF